MRRVPERSVGRVFRLVYALATFTGARPSANSCAPANLSGMTVLPLGSMNPNRPSMLTYVSNGPLPRTSLRPFSTVMSPSGVTDETLSLLRADDEPAGAVDEAPPAALDESGGEATGEALRLFELRPDDHLAGFVDIAVFLAGRDDGTPFGKREGGVELRRDHRLARSIDVSPLAIDPHGCPTIAEHRSATELQRNDEGARRIDETDFLLLEQVEHFVTNHLYRRFQGDVQGSLSPQHGLNALDIEGYVGLLEGVPGL